MTSYLLVIKIRKHTERKKVVDLGSLNQNKLKGNVLGNIAYITSSIDCKQKHLNDCKQINSTQPGLKDLHM